MYIYREREKEREKQTIKKLQKEIKSNKCIIINKCVFKITVLRNKRIIKE